MNSMPVPWLNYSVLFYLGSVLQGNERVFEYGAGNSTLWWAKRVSRVTSVEHNMEWCNYLASNLPANSELIHAEELTPYVDAIKGRGQFDIVLIDGGPDRSKCVKPAFDHLAPGGLIIFDNMEVPSHSRAASRLQSEMGLGRIDFFGLTPSCGRLTMTSVFSSDFSKWTAKSTDFPYSAPGLD